MAHLNDEDIARLIDGTVSDVERRGFISHLADCDDCRTIYSETVKFQEESAGDPVSAKNPPKGPYGINRLMTAMVPLMGEKTTIMLIAATVVILLLSISFFNEWLNYGKNLPAKLGAIEQQAALIDKTNPWAFSPEASNLNTAAFHAGVFFEDLQVTLQDDSKRKLTGHMAQLLHHQLSIIFKDDGEPTGAPLQSATPKDLLQHLERLDQRMEKHSTSQYYFLGRFIEKTMLDSFDGKRPSERRLEKFRTMALSGNLPRGVPNWLEKMKRERNETHIRNYCREIKELFHTL